MTLLVITAFRRSARRVDALKLVARFLTLHPQDPWTLRGKALRNALEIEDAGTQGKIPSCLTPFADTAELPAGCMDEWMATATELASPEILEHLIAAYLETHANTPHRFELNFIRALLPNQFGNPQKAYAHLKTLWEMTSDQSKCLSVGRRLATIALQTDHVSTAIDVLSHCREFAPKDPELKKQFDDGLSLQRQLKVLSNEMADALYACLDNPALSSEQEVNGMNALANGPQAAVYLLLDHLASYLQTHPSRPHYLELRCYCIDMLASVHDYQPVAWSISSPCSLLHRHARERT